MAHAAKPDVRPAEPHSRRSRLRALWASFGPGLLWAAASIGVSHLVQSTRAGATAGFALAGIILVAVILKYPFFEFGPRYAAATGTSLVEGYRRIGAWALWLYLGITIATAVIIEAVIVLFTAFLLIYVLGLSWSVPAMALVLYAACGLLLWIGRFRLLDRTVKGVLAVLAASTLIAAALALPEADLSTLTVWPDGGWEAVVPAAFILALVGWMPSAVDVSVWSSLWTQAKDESSGERATVETARLDFLVGYAGTGLMAFAFLTLGAAVLYGTGESFSAQGTAFSVQLVDLYGQTLGGWARPLVAVAVLTTMLSTSLTVIDGFPRAIARSIHVLRAGVPTGEDPASGGTNRRLYWAALIAVGIAVLVVLSGFTRSLTGMVDFATIVSFLTAPVLGYLNLRAVTSPEVPPRHRPGRGMRLLAYLGLALLGGTGVLYLITLVA